MSVLKFVYSGSSCHLVFLGRVNIENELYDGIKSCIIFILEGVLIYRHDIDIIIIKHWLVLNNICGIMTEWQKEKFASPPFIIITVVRCQVQYLFSPVLVFRSESDLIISGNCTGQSSHLSSLGSRNLKETFLSIFSSTAPPYVLSSYLLKVWGEQPPSVGKKSCVYFWKPNIQAPEFIPTCLNMLNVYTMYFLGQNQNLKWFKIELYNIYIQEQVNEIVRRDEVTDIEDTVTIRCERTGARKKIRAAK